MQISDPVGLIIHVEDGEKMGTEKRIADYYACGTPRSSQKIVGEGEREGGR